MATPEVFRLGPYELDGARFYDAATHLWATRSVDRRVRCGFDPLGAEICGDVVAVSFEPLGTSLARGEAFGQVEAAKFVGPLLAPVGGVITAHNGDALADPAQLNVAPMETWLIELDASNLEADLEKLVGGRAAVEPWFAAEIEKFERQGMIAE